MRLRYRSHLTDKKSDEFDSQGQDLEILKFNHTTKFELRSRIQQKLK